MREMERRSVGRADEVGVRRAWWRLYRAMELLGSADVSLEARSVVYMMDQMAQREHLRRGVERGELEGVTREEVLV